MPFFGFLRSARVFILMLNPGLHAGDYFSEAECPSCREAVITNLCAELPFLWLNPTLAWHPGFGYWHAKFRKIIAALASAWHLPYLDALKAVAEHIAVLQLFPYHSARFRILDRTLRQLRSVRLMQAYVHDVLVPRACRAEVLIVVTRKTRYWRLPADKNILMYQAHEARGAHLSPSSRGGARILEYLQDRNQTSIEKKSGHYS